MVDPDHHLETNGLKHCVFFHSAFWNRYTYGKPVHGKVFLRLTLPLTFYFASNSNDSHEPLTITKEYTGQVSKLGKNTQQSFGVGMNWDEPGLHSQIRVLDQSLLPQCHAWLLQASEEHSILCSSMQALFLEWFFFPPSPPPLTLKFPHFVLPHPPMYETLLLPYPFMSPQLSLVYPSFLPALLYHPHSLP